MNSLRKAGIASLLGFAVMSMAHAAPMTNADVLKLLDAGMPDSVIIQSIASSSGTKFDTSADALIKLKGRAPALR